MSVSSLGTPSNKKPLLSDLTYNRLKKTATIILPALSALYFALSQIWHFPNVEEVMGTIAAVTTFLGGGIQVSKKSYYASGAQYAGAIKIMDNGTKKLYSVEMNDHPATLDTMSEATFQIQPVNTADPAAPTA